MENVLKNHRVIPEQGMKIPCFGMSYEYDCILKTALLADFGLRIYWQIRIQPAPEIN